MSRGSAWNIWDFHLHTPASILNNQFGDPGKDEVWEEFIKKIEEEAKKRKIVAIGITDYFSIEGYKKLREFKEKGRLKGILIFPNIEFRIDKFVGENKKVNMHVIFSPDTSVKDIEERFLQKLEFVFEEETFGAGTKTNLTMSNLEDFGKQLKKQHPKFQDRSDLLIGCMNAIVDPRKIKENLKDQDKFFKGNYILALAEENTAICDWDGGSHGVRKHLTQMSHAFFSSNSKTRDFCLGRKHNSKEEFIEEFKTSKPCIWGCDSHSFTERFLEPAKNEKGEINYCWIKADVSWEGLKQILYEPEERICIQEESPESQKSIYTLDSLSVAQTKFNEALEISSTKLDLNRNLVTVIGGRGSGKTALLDIIASLFSEGKGLNQIKTSFFYRLYGDKTKKSKNIETEVKFLSQDSFKSNIGAGDKYFDKADIVYLAQKHFDELSGNYEKLRSYVLELIFKKFSEEKVEYTKHTDQIKKQLNKIQSLSLQIDQLLSGIEAVDQLQVILDKKEGEKKDCEERLKAIEKKTEPNKDVSLITKDLTNLRIRKKKIEDLIKEFSTLAINIKEFSISSQKMNNLNNTLKEIFEENESLYFFPETDLINIVERSNEAARENEKALKDLLKNIDKEMLEKKSKLEEYSDKDKTIIEFRERINSVNSQIEETKKKIKKASEDKQKILDLESERLNEYIEIRNISESMLSFLKSILKRFEKGKDEILKNLYFEPTIQVNLESIAGDILEKIDTRSLNQNDLRDLLNKTLIDSLQNKESSSLLINKVRQLEDSLNADRKKKVTRAEIANSIFQNPFDIKMNILLDKKPLEVLSMGQRAVVLLKIVLAYDDKPLIIDQPEEDLDNKYIYEHLVPAFREAKKRRQIIIATHNANLVINSDAEQIIIATCENGRIFYKSGALEEKSIRDEVTKVLEGGEEAFKRREEKYGLVF